MKKTITSEQLRMVYADATKGPRVAREWLRSHPFHVGAPVLITLFIFMLVKGSLLGTLGFGGLAVWAAANLLHDHITGGE